MNRKLLARLRGGLIVSSQAPAGSPLGDPRVLSAMALAATQAGAAGLRLDGPEVIRVARGKTRVPIIGIHKARAAITPRFALARELARAGADLIALEATQGRPDAGRLMARIQGELGLPVIADVSNLKEGEHALSCGADMLASTLSGYTGKTPAPQGPDLGLVRALARLGAPVMAEGRYATREQVLKALALGAHCVCVGGAITRPDLLTKDLLP